MHDINSSDNEFEKIKSLAKFYDSIPDYCDINHLSENEFNNVLNNLRENSLKLRCKSASTYNINDREKNKIYAGNTTRTTTTTRYLNPIRPSTSITNYSTYKDLTKYSKSNYSGFNRRKITGSNKKSKKQLKKSCSMSQLYDEMDALDLKSDDIYSPTENIKDTKNSLNSTFRKNSLGSACTKPKKKFKNIFASILPNLTCPTIYPSDPKFNSNNSNASNSPKNKIVKISSSKNNCDIATFLGTEMKKSDSKKVSLSSAPSPMYPAARSNLAATLRAQLSHKPHLEPVQSPKELKVKSNNKSNWDVKRTPGWKSLIYRETNKEDIMYRLATRRAEQKLQKQEYDMNMELMKQRVKSAPLLLEGMTYWNTRINNRSYHNCFTTNSSRLSVRPRKKHCSSARKIKPLQQGQQLVPAETDHENHINNNNNINNQNNQNNNNNTDNDDLTSEDRAYL